MGTFTGPALNGFVQGQRLYDQDARIEEKHDWARDENARAEGRHVWAGETHNTTQNRRRLENRALERAEADDQEYRAALGKDSLTIGGMQAQKDKNAYEDAQKERERKQDMALMARGFFQFENSGDPSFLTGAMGQTFLGKGKSYTPQWDKEKKTFSIINRDGKVILSAQGQTHEDMMDKLQDMLITGLSDPANYLKARKAQRSALNLERLKHKNSMDKLGKENEGKIAVEQIKGANKRKEIKLQNEIKGKGQKYITLPSAVGGGEKLTFKEARQQLTDLGKYLKEKSGDQALANMMSVMRGGHVSPEEVLSSDEGQIAIERIEKIAQSETDSRARGYAQRFLAIVDQMYGSFQQSGDNSNYGPALNTASVGMGSNQDPKPIKGKYSSTTPSWRDF